MSVTITALNCCNCGAPMSYQDVICTFCGTGLIVTHDFQKLPQWTGDCVADDYEKPKKIPKIRPCISYNYWDDEETLIKDMCNGDEGYAVPWALSLEGGHPRVHNEYSISNTEGGTAEMWLKKVNGVLLANRRYVQSYIFEEKSNNRSMRTWPISITVPIKLV